MLEEFLNLENKVNILTQYCRELKEENKRLKEMLSKNESDMYSLIEEKDILAKEKVELSNKIGEIITDNSRISNLIHTIDSAMEDYDNIEKSEQKTLEHRESKVVQKIEQKIEESVANIGKKEEHIEHAKENITIETENKTAITQATSIVHVKEDEDPFSKANDNDWDNDVEVSNLELGDDGLEDKKINKLDDDKQKVVGDSKEKVTSDSKQKVDTVENISDDYNFEIEDDDGYVFSDDNDDEDSGFIFEEEK